MTTHLSEIDRMQERLLLIRTVVGWTAEDFGNRIGVTRQTINNLEKSRIKLSKTQYIAMRSVLDEEIRTYPEETKMLQLILDAFIDHPEKYSEEERRELLSKANLISPSILTKTMTRKDVSDEYIKIAKMLGIVLSMGPIMGTWLRKIIESNRDKS